MSYYVSASGNVSFEPRANVKEIEKRFDDLLELYDRGISSFEDGLDIWSYFNWNSIGTDFEDLLADIADKCAEGEIEFSAEDGEFWKYEFNSKTKKWDAHNGVKDYEFAYELKKEGEE